VGKWWSLLFAVVMLACLGMFVAAPFVGWWLPEAVSTHADSVDTLFYVILYITGFFFILTEALLVVFMFQYAGGPGQKTHVFGEHAQEKKVFWTSFFKSTFRPVSAFLHNQHRVELAWTLVPALILLYIAFAQVSTWANVKYQSRMNAYMNSATPIQLEVSARQFEWRVRYPSPDRLEGWLKSKVDPTKDVDFKSFARVPHQDDVHVVNEVHAVKGQPVLVQLRTIDVLHSFNIPHMRVKQDALPGKVIPVWFTPIKANTRKTSQGWEDNYDTKTQKGDRWDIACAELCGWGHYRMVGRLHVHETQQDFIDWLRKAQENQGTKTTPAAVR
jgi:cytochrome c oxidase subunit 2